jgi:hypothetical protein
VDDAGRVELTPFFYEPKCSVMNRKPKPHVRRDLVKPLERFYRRTVEGMRPFDRYISGMSPVDGIGCLGFLKRASYEMRDAANEFVATVDAHAQRVRWMKEANRKRRERS